MGRKKARSRDELKEASAHIHYEKWMMAETANALYLNSFGSGTYVSNAVLESFLTHMRNLIDFLYLKGHEANNDWILAEDYFCGEEDEWRKERGDMSRLLEESKVRAAQELAHLSYARLKRTGENKNWSFLSIAAELDSGLKTFTRLVSEELLHDVWNDHLEQIKKK